MRHLLVDTMEEDSLEDSLEQQGNLHKNKQVFV